MLHKLLIHLLKNNHVILQLQYLLDSLLFLCKLYYIIYIIYPLKLLFNSYQIQLNLLDFSH